MPKPTTPASFAMAALAGLLLGCDSGLPSNLVSVSPCATGTWHGTTGTLSLVLALQVSQDCAWHPPASATVHGTGTVTQGAASTGVAITGSQAWMDLLLTWRSADSSVVAAYSGHFGAPDSVIGVLTCSHGCPSAVDSTFVLLKQ